MLIDTHCHLSDERFTDLKQTLEEAKMNGVEKVVVPATSLEDSRKVVEIAEKYQQYALVGVHPENIEETNVEELVEALEKLVKSSRRVVGIGEIGMDFFYEPEKKSLSAQKELFRTQLELALDLELPTVIHCRAAEKETKEVLEGLERMPKGQFHCFGGDEEFLKWVLGNGFYVSFCGNITYKSASNLRELLHKVPLERLLLETDSPYLAPEPKRGTVNSPSNVKIIAEFIARELNIDTLELAEATSQNAKCLYSLDI